MSPMYMVYGHEYDTSDFAVVRVMILLSIYMDDSKFLHVMVYSLATVQVESFESPSC